MSWSYTIFVVFLFEAFASAAQESAPPVRPAKTEVGIVAGVNASYFNESDYRQPRGVAGLALGVYLKKQISAIPLFVRTELYYSHQGQKTNYLYPNGGPSTGTTTTQLHYVNVPFLLELDRKIIFQAGAQLGVLLAGTERGIVDGAYVNSNLHGATHPVDFSLAAGAGYAFSKRISGGVRFNYGLTSIFRDRGDPASGDNYPSAHNRVLRFYLAWSF